MAETIDDADEMKLVSAVKKAIDLVESKGMSPDEAVEKLARDNGFGPGKIRVIGHAYNTGRQTAQWNDGGNVLNKLASYGLCDPERVIDAIYNGPSAAEKAAADRVDPAYARPPSWLKKSGGMEKAAYALPAPTHTPNAPEPIEALHKANGKVQRTKQAADEARRAASAAGDEVVRKVAGLVGYFRKSAYDRLPFADVEEACRAYYGDAGAALAGLVYKQARLVEKRAAAKPVPRKTPLDLSAEPFTLVKAAIDAAGECDRLRKEAKAGAEKIAAVRVEALRPFTAAGAATKADPGVWSEKAAEVFGVEKAAFGFGTEVAAIAGGDILGGTYLHHNVENKKPEDESDPYGDVGDLEGELARVRAMSRRAIGRPVKTAAEKKAAEKKAILNTPAVGAAVGTMLARTVGSVPKTKDDMVDDAWMDLEDPEHANELRKIRTHAMLNQLMTDPDEPISGHDQDKVLSAYNEIAGASPRVADNIATLRPQLRKRLEGHQEPFETKELLDTEKALAQTRMPTPNTNIMSEAPDKLLG